MKKGDDLLENSIPMGKNEYLVKNYPIQDYTVPKVKTRTESQVTVTNRRIVYTQKVTDKSGGSVYTKRDFDINTVETVDTDFAFNKVYNVALIIIGAIIALVGLVVLLVAKQLAAGLIVFLVGGVIVALTILLAKKCYSFNLAIHTFGASETNHIQFGASSLKPEKEKKKKPKKRKKRFVLLKKLFKSKVQNIGLIPDSIEAMVAEIGSYVVEFKK